MLVGSGDAQASPSSFRGPSVVIDVAEKTKDTPPRGNVWVRLQTVARQKLSRFLPDLGWVRDKLNWSDLKPVIRSAISAWACLILLLVSKSGKLLGQASLRDLSLTLNN